MTNTSRISPAVWALQASPLPGHQTQSYEVDTERRHRSPTCSNSFLLCGTEVSDMLLTFSHMFSHMLTVSHISHIFSYVLIVSHISQVTKYEKYGKI